jgi:non-ribosomal peptide synthetase-like protein
MFAVSLLITALAFVNYDRYGTAALMAGSLSITAFVIAVHTFMEWLSLHFRPLQPKVASIYDPYFWFHERHWKWSWLQLPFKGTPFKNVVSRMLGVKVGRKVFDDGCWFAENTLIEVGDYSSLNEATTIQGHSLEEGVFKSDRIKVGSGCTIDVGAYIHYGVQMGDRVVVQPDSFVMKGEVLEPHSIWRGNPARAVRQKVERPSASVPTQRPTSEVMSSAAA